jgi:hypothetical protein
VHGPSGVSPRRLEALRALAERGATAGEREAARVALESALRGPAPDEPALQERPRPARRARSKPSQACRWIKLGGVWAITGPEAALRSGRVTVQAHGRRAREVVVADVRQVDDLWIADEAPAAEPRRTAPPRPAARPAARPGPGRSGQRPPPPYRRPDLLPEHFMQCWRLEDMLEELAGSEVLAAVKVAMERGGLDEPRRRARLIAEIWRQQKD